MNKLKGINKRSWLSTPYLIWIIGFTVIPMAVIFRYALSSPEGGFTLANVAAIADPVHLKAVIFSLEIAVGCTLICILLSYPLVLALRRLNLGKRGFALFVLILPMWMNFILRVLAWQMILSNNGILNLLLQKIGLEPVALANSGVAIMIGVVYDYLPYMVLPIFNAVSDDRRGYHRCCKRSRSRRIHDLPQDHLPAFRTGTVERNCDGICSIDDFVCDLGYFGRRKTAADR